MLILTGSIELHSETTETWLGQEYRCSRWSNNRGSMVLQARGKRQVIQVPWTLTNTGL